MRSTAVSTTVSTTAVSTTAVSTAVSTLGHTSRTDIVARRQRRTGRCHIARRGFVLLAQARGRVHGGAQVEVQVVDGVVRPHPPDADGHDRHSQRRHSLELFAEGSLRHPHAPLKVRAVRPHLVGPLLHHHRQHCLCCARRKAVAHPVPLAVVGHPDVGVVAVGQARHPCHGLVVAHVRPSQHHVRVPKTALPLVLPHKAADAVDAVPRPEDILNRGVVVRVRPLWAGSHLFARQLVERKQSVHLLLLVCVCLANGQPLVVVDVERHALLATGRREDGIRLQGVHEQVNGGLPTQRSHEAVLDRRQRVVEVPHGAVEAERDAEGVGALDGAISRRGVTEGDRVWPRRLRRHGQR
mmetsp:Transcript_10549/g.25125  ORF Transcript_10549/g.25125 Transcript_10549/m.25125 type:complete len:354 (-) Transcript_10549:49-1110(-)